MVCVLLNLTNGHRCGRWSTTDVEHHGHFDSTGFHHRGLQVAVVRHWKYVTKIAHVLNRPLLHSTCCQTVMKRIDPRPDPPQERVFLKLSTFQVVNFSILQLFKSSTFDDRPQEDVEEHELLAAWAAGLHVQAHPTHKYAIYFDRPTPKILCFGSPVLLSPTWPRGCTCRHIPLTNTRFQPTVLHPKIVFLCSLSYTRISCFPVISYT